MDNLNNDTSAPHKGAATTWPANASRLLSALRGLGAAAALIVSALSWSAGHAAAADKPFVICEQQKYALCATASCFMMNDVAYCKCDIEKGDSISLNLDYTGGGNACTFNAEGVGNGYMLSTYSLPPSVEKGGNQALYTCDEKTSTGSYAQCDGGVCFKSTRGHEFPGLGTLTDEQIVCSCPTVTADPSVKAPGYQMVGPYPCEKSFFKYCKGKTANTDNGSSIVVGATTGTPRFLTKQLYGEVPPLNRCLP